MIPFLLIALTAAASSKTANTEQSSPQRICQEFKTTGTRLSKKVCRTDAEWRTYDVNQKHEAELRDDLRNRTFRKNR